MQAAEAVLVGAVPDDQEDRVKAVVMAVLPNHEYVERPHECFQYSQTVDCTTESAPQPPPRVTTEIMADKAHPAFEHVLQHRPDLGECVLPPLSLLG